MEDEQGVPENSAAEWELVKELLYRWEIDQPEELDAWLTVNCATASIRREVERLVRAAATSGNFMQGKAVENHFGVSAQRPVHIGRYRVIEELGAGGLGVVYAAYDPSLERKVAIKVLAEQATAGSDRSKRLRWDAKAASATNHPNIVVIHDIGNDEGSDYIVMECVEGHPLGKLIPSGGLPGQTVLHYALQIASALDTAHRGGIVHRDLKPNNIMITEDGVVKILDFGLAKLDNSAADYTSVPNTIEGHFAGTVAYVSPEQAEGKPVDARGDIFAFGCILFEMLTGRQAFQGTSAVSVLGRILHQQAPALRQVASQVDERFEPILERCLQKNPDQRFSSIAEVRERLAELVEEEKPASRFSNRTRRLMVRWAAGTGIVALLGLVGLQFASQLARPKVEKFVTQRLTSDRGLTSFPAVSWDGKVVAYASDRAGGGNLDLWIQNWGSSDATRLTSNAADEYSPAFSPSGSELVYRSEQDGGGLWAISTLGGNSRLLAKGGRDGRYSRDGLWLAYWTGEIGYAMHRGCARILLEREGRQAEEFPPGFDAAAYPVWSADGERLLFLGRKAGDEKPDWWVAGLRDKIARPTGLLRQLSGEGGSNSYREYFAVPSTWLPDGTVFFTAKRYDATNIWAVRIDKNGTAPDVPYPWTNGTTVEDYPSAVLQLPSARTRVVYASLTVDSAIWRMPLSPVGETSGPPAAILTGLDLASPSLSDDGRKLAYMAHEPGGNSIRLVELGAHATGNAVTIKVGQTARRPMLSGDGTTVALAMGDGGYVMPVGGGDPENICPNCGPPSDVSFDGKVVIFEGGGTSTDLQVGGRGQTSRLLFPPVKGSQFRWRQSEGRVSPNRRWLVFSGSREGSPARSILIAPMAADGTALSSQIEALVDDRFSNRQPAWSPDGRTLYFLSTHDGPVCIWALHIDPVTARLLQPPFPMAHFHHASQVVRGFSADPGKVGLSVARGFLVLTMTETKGDIWARTTQAQ